jgi:hypothetical protein
VGQVVGLAGRWQQQRLLLGGEDLGEAGLGGAVDAQAGPRRAPLRGVALGVSQIDERLAGEHRTPDEGNVAFHPGFILRVPHPGRVDHEPPRLGVLDERLVEARFERVGVVDDRLAVVEDQHPEHPAEERPRRVAALDHRGGRLAVGEPHELVAGVARREDQSVHVSRIVEVPHSRSLKFPS